MPKTVSMRVVKTRILVSDPFTARSNSTPSERPIQLRCITSTRLGPSDAPRLCAARRRAAPGALAPPRGGDRLGGFVGRADHPLLGPPLAPPRPDPPAR